jgi:hypothetical protein
LAVALALAVASASAFGAAIALLERGELRIDRTAPIQPASPTSSPDLAFRFLDRVSGGAPRRWDPCRQLTYRINVATAPPGAVEDVTEAVQRAADATGISFTALPSTTEDPYQQAIGSWSARITIGADIVFVWLSHDRFVRLLRDLGMQPRAVAFGVPFEGVGEAGNEWSGGLIVTDAGRRLRPGFGRADSQGVVLMHELGHVLGLAHVDDPSEVMYSGHALDLRVTDWGQGDREGLRQLGREAGCDP